MMLMEEIATNFLETTRNAFFIGRTIDYNVSLEGALKLKKSLIFRLKDLLVVN